MGKKREKTDDYSGHYVIASSIDCVDEQSYSSADSIVCSRLSTMLNTAVKNQFEGGVTAQNSCVSPVRMVLGK